MTVNKLTVYAGTASTYQEWWGNRYCALIQREVVGGERKKGKYKMYREERIGKTFQH